MTTKARKTSDRSIGSMVRQGDTSHHGRDVARREPRRQGTRAGVVRTAVREG